MIEKKKKGFNPKFTSLVELIMLIGGFKMKRMLFPASQWFSPAGDQYSWAAEG